MEAPQSATTSELREAVLAAYQTVQRLQAASDKKAVIGGDALTKAEAAYRGLAREYAVHRIANGSGIDPEVLDRETFNEVLYAMASPGRFGRRAGKKRSSSLSRDTMTSMLTPRFDIGDILKTLRTSSEGQILFDQQTPIRRLIRRWAEHTASDPFIDRRLREVSVRDADFTTAIKDADSMLDEIRRRYEAEHGTERLGVKRDAKNELQVIATVRWGALAEAYPEDSDEVHTSLANAEMVARQIQKTAKEINQELSLFFRELVPRYFGLLLNVPRKKRQELTGGVRPTPALAAKLLDATDVTDFVADTDLKLGFEERTIPTRFRPLIAQSRYQKVREVTVGQRARDASTVVIRRAPSAPHDDES